MRIAKFFTDRLKRFAGSVWYIPCVVLFAALDAYIFVVPIESLLVPAALIHPKRWISLSVWVSFGSALGAASFAVLASHYGQPVLAHWFPSAFESPKWAHMTELLSRHGAWELALVSLSPFPQHPAVAIAGLAHMQWFIVLGAVFVGRLPKYLFVAWAAVNSPRVLRWLHLAKQPEVQKP